MKLHLVAALTFFSLVPNAFAESVSVTAPGVSITVPAADDADSTADIEVASSGVTISVTGSDDFSSEKVKYKCGDQDVVATYINANDISLVQLDFSDKTIVAANVLAASGAKYAGDQYIWWENEGEVSLYNIIDDTEQKKPIACLEDANETGE
ncbi:MliC family protein [Bartonella sp. HY329]|uniref:MliC family protein n=1 Tax=unclassified Bartonella TaxID=2645622 RepID=UPI0021C7D608|nr:MULTISPECIES: MliC family protein [unclassified Bartonella]UXM95926.1 MliC family protein [Bartonella sp. HY329]UXN10251.1 MliC family protein [Bartonella sp. HY328]